MSENLSRRSLLRLGGLVSGGLILPWSGSKVLALAEPATAADLAVTSTEFPVSNEMIAYRAMMREHASWRLAATISARRADTLNRPGDTLPEEVRRRTKLHERYAAEIFQRPVRSWSDVAALAEIAWAAAPKAGPYNVEKFEPLYNPPRLARTYVDTDMGYRGGDGTFVRDFSLSANAALIEGVLAMTGGERFDPYSEFCIHWEAHQIGTTINN